MKEIPTVEEMTKNKWTLESALVLVQDIETNAVGWHVGLTGSILYKGQSGNDLDIILYPRNNMNISHKKALYGLQRAGLHLKMTRAAVAAKWEDIGSTDSKHVEKWETEDGRTVDIFFLR